MAKNIEIIFYWVQGGLSLMWFFDNCTAAVADFEISRLATLEYGINIRVRSLIFEVFSRGYFLIKGGYVY